MMGIILSLLVTFLQQPVGDSVHLSAPEGYVVQTFTVNDGLPAIAVEDIYQDERGYLYFATLNGLARYDGYAFRVYNSANTSGISTNRFTKFINRSGEGIWIHTEQNYLTWLNNGTFTTFEDVFTVLTDRNGETWSGTPTGISRYDETQNDFTELPGLPKEMMIPTRQFISLERGLLIRNDAGIFLKEGGNFRAILPLSEFPIGNRDRSIMEPLDDEHVFIHSSMGFFILDLYSKEIVFVQEFTPENILDIWKVEGRNNRIIMSAKQGVFEIDPVSWEIRELPVESYNFREINSEGFKRGRILTKVGPEFMVNGQALYNNEEVRIAFQDREGSIWIATPRDGLHQFKSVPLRNISSAHGEPLENTYPIIQDKNGDIWVGSFLTGVYQFSGRGINHWNAENSALTSNAVRYLYEDVDGTIYLSLWEDGLWKFTGNDWERTYFLNSVTNRDVLTFEAMHRDHNGVLIIGNRDTPIFKKGERLTTLQDSVGVGFKGVRVIRETNLGTIFMGSIGDGLGILFNDGSFRQFSTTEGLSSNFIRDILIQSEDTIWIATENMGLDRVVFGDEVPEIVSVRQADGLIDDALHRIIEDKQERWWISSNRGVMWISKKDLYAFADGKIEFLPVRKYDEKKGMLNQEANGGVMSAGILTSDNKIWFPNQKGVTIFDPTKAGHIHYNEVITPVIETVATEDSVILLSGKASINLPKGQRNFAIKFTAPNFDSPENIGFRYQLTGIGNRWQIANSLREASFTNISSGDHEFRLQIVFPDGETSLASLQLYVPPFYYETAWFRVLIGLLILGIGVMIFRVRMHNLRMREKELQWRVKEQTQELEIAAEEKSRFFAGITHELKTPLSLILGPLDDFLDDPTEVSEKKLRNYTRLMHRNGYRLKNLVDQILDVSKLNADAKSLHLQPCDIVNFTKSIAGQFQSLMEQQGIFLEVEADYISEPLYVDKDAWERIIINLMSNAIKFSPGGERIRISIKEKRDLVQIAIRDFGKGISESEAAKVFEYLYQVEGSDAAEGTGIGLYLVKGLLDRMGGAVTVISKEGSGAEFIVQLKKGRDHFNKKDRVLEKMIQIEEPSPPKTSSTYVVENETLLNKSVNRETILLVEDNADFRTYLVGILSEQYNVEIAVNGMEGLSIASEASPDLIISDVMMPVMGGFEFVNSIRTNEAFRTIPVIFLSAKDQGIDIQEGLSTGADIYLTKPIRTRTLISQISAILRRERILKQKKENTSIKSNETEFVQNLRNLVYQHMANPSLNVNMIADSLYMSRSKLYREWNQHSEVSIIDFIKKIRFDEATFLIKEQGFSIQDAAQATGFSNQKYFSTSFKKEFGYSPSEIKS